MSVMMVITAKYQPQHHKPWLLPRGHQTMLVGRVERDNYPNPSEHINRIENYNHPYNRYKIISSVEYKRIQIKNDDTVNTIIHFKLFDDVGKCIVDIPHKNDDDEDHMQHFIGWFHAMNAEYVRYKSTVDEFIKELNGCK